MLLQDIIERSGWGAEIRASVVFIVVALAGAVMLAVLGIVLGASATTSFGYWPGLVVILLSSGAAILAWRYHPSPERGRGGGSAGLTNPSPQSELQFPKPGTRIKVREPAPAPKPSSSPEAPLDTGDVLGLKRTFDQAVNSGQFDEASRLVALVALHPEEFQWVNNKRRLLNQMRSRM
jgi:hypothetical protein